VEIDLNTLAVIRAEEVRGVGETLWNFRATVNERLVAVRKEVPAARLLDTLRELVARCGGSVYVEIQRLNQ